MKSRRNSWSIPLQLLRNRVQTRGDHDELEIFLKIHLIPSRIDQKLKNKREIHRFLKGNFARRSWPIDAVVGAICRGRESCSLGIDRGFNSATNLLQFRFRKHHDRAKIASWSFHDRVAIGPRSWVNCDLNPQWMPFNDRGDDSTTKDPRSQLDRATIAVRSDCNRGVLPWVVLAVRWSLRLDGDRTFQKGPRVAKVRWRSWPSDGDRPVAMCLRNAPDRERSRPHDEDLMKIRSRPWSTTIKSRWESNASDASTCHQVSPLIRFHLCPFCSTCFDEDCVDCGSRDRRLCVDLRRL